MYQIIAKLDDSLDRIPMMHEKFLEDFEKNKKLNADNKRIQKEKDEIAQLKKRNAEQIEMLKKSK